VAPRAVTGGGISWPMLALAGLFLILIVGPCREECRKPSGSCRSSQQ
jgi:hypothetical protein